MKRINLLIMMCLLTSVGAWADTLKGKVIDQNAQPVVGATITCLNHSESDNSLLASTTSDADGNWELNYEHTWQDIQIKATKEGHTSYTTYLDVSMRHTWPKFIFRLINALDYEAGKRSTIYLPDAPDASWGRFFRLDREEENKVIFERELTPKAYVPYVFFPDQDLHIDISGMDLSDHWNRVNLQHISLSSQINFMASEAEPGSLITWSLDESLSYAEYSEEGANEDSGFLPPMHAILSWMYYTWNGYTWNGAKPELVFHDPEIIVTGAITDQDGKPVQNAVVTVYNNSASYQATTDNRGCYQMSIENGDQTYSSRIDAEGYTSVSRGPYIKPNVNNVFDFILYNALYYKADEQSTIILPVAPDPSAGTYYRLDRVENKIIIFEPEPEPKAHVPYVFFPNQDLRIDLRGMDLTTKNGGSTFINMSETNNEHEGVEFVGSYTHQCDIPMFESDWIRYFDSNAKGIRAGLHDLDAMHALLKIDGHAFRTHNIPEVFFMGRDKEYRSFIEEGKVWKVGWFPGAMDIARKWDYYYFEGDSIIDGRQCKIMRCRHEAAEGWGNPVPWTEYVGSIYEEGRRVYCVFPQKETFELLYDFASAVADTICIHDPCVNDYIGFGIIEERGTESEEYYKGNYTAVAIYQEYWDSQNEENHLSKHYDREHLCYWMEGVGSGNPLDNVCHWEWAGNYYMGVYCTVGDEVLYKNTNPYIVDGVTPQDSEVKKNWLDFTHTVKTKPKVPSVNGKWTARPNGTLDPSRTGRLTPQECSATSDEETVTGEYSVKELFVNFKTLAGPYTITMTDAAGQPIYNKVVQTSNVVALNTDISAYPKGEYTITVENEEEMYTAEFNIKDEDGLTPTVQSSMFKVQSTIYNLNGQRLTKPQHGVNIVNGRKVVVK